MQRNTQHKDYFTKILKKIYQFITNKQTKNKETAPNFSFNSYEIVNEIQICMRIHMAHHKYIGLNLEIWNIILYSTARTGHQLCISSLSNHILYSALSKNLTYDLQRKL